MVGCAANLVIGIEYIVTVERELEHTVVVVLQPQIKQRVAGEIEVFAVLET